MRQGATAEGEAVSDSISLRTALSEMVARGTDRLADADDAGQPLGAVFLDDLVRP
jgi:CBS domain-containing protein